MTIADLTQLRKAVDQAVGSVKVTDVHTHLFEPTMGGLLLWGVDELITYHYLIAETMRWTDMPYDAYYALTREQQADLIWQKLFIENSPYSEACRGVLTVLHKLGFDLSGRSLQEAREYFRMVKVEDHINRVFDIANLESVVMTNDPFDPAEAPVWLKGFAGDKRFHAALRIDPLLNSYDTAFKVLQQQGYGVDGSLSAADLKEIRRFLTDWIKRMNPVYMAVSLPAGFMLPEESARATIIEECIIPISRELNVPFAMMIGVKRLVNPGLRLSGDSVGLTSLQPVEYLCAKYPENKFLCTMLSRENQHELAVTARKFRNLLVFGCWWFLNNPSLIDEITRMRFELLGISVVPQHSDARILDQVIYKWDHSRKIIANVLADKYADLMATGWRLEESEIQRDVAKLFGGNFWSFLGR